MFASLQKSPTALNRRDIADLIITRIEPLVPQLKAAYQQSGPIGYFAVDDLLPAPIAQEIAKLFPQKDALTFKSTARERKYVSSQMNQHAPLIEEALFAFHDERLVKLCETITGHTPLHADPMLYAGGVSSMQQECFLNPHIDNSHDKQRARWRSLNLLYYVSPDWQAFHGGNLELWPHGVKNAPITIPSLFNRLVVMSTHHHSLHSVSPVQVQAARNCISNYYFSEKPMHPEQPFHVTAFRGRPEQPLRDMILRGDAALRMGLRKLKSGGFFKTGHWYEASK